MGDLIQSTPLLKSIKQANPGSEIVLMVNSRFSAICSRMPFVDRVIKFDVEKTGKNIVDAEKSLIESYHEIESLVCSLNNEKFNKIYNLTHSKMSALLTAMIAVNEINGICVDSKGFRLIKNQWMVYFFNAAINRHFNPFNLVDMYLLSGGAGNSERKLSLDITEEDRKDALSFYEKSDLKKDDILIGMQPGASKSHKQWPVDFFASLARMLSEKLNVKIVLFGSEQERPIGAQIESISGVKVINTMGKTTVQNLSAFVSRCSVLITNDTGTMHVATAAGVKVIEISFGPVNFWETGPYGEGHAVIQTSIVCAPCGFNVTCLNEICKKTIVPEEVFLLTEEMLGLKEIKDVRDSGKFLNSRVYKTTFDECGFLDFYPLVYRKIDENIFWRQIYRGFWKSIIKDVAEEQEGKEVFGKISGRYDVSGVEHFSHSLKSTADAISKIEMLASEGEGLVKKIVDLLSSSSTKKHNTHISELAKKVSLIDVSIEEIASITRQLSPVCDVYRMKRESIDSDDPAKVAWAYLALYRELRKYCLSFKNILRPFIDYHGCMSSVSSCSGSNGVLQDVGKI